ncbi:uncharacterized protein LOC130816145 [Amaranthus tricolor]|uniref:uncharacterized protein LOC130816145 n=1 Tax=Amaranthus tricolor TaxID=29722 RepID=UPI00258AB085|nr:uncharacterized protein LOC130816145 [Amaranthus tricolor]XP_057538778.1 uncharacterized protein LOC130816145 [Amaranthus tricolor]
MAESQDPKTSNQNPKPPVQLPPEPPIELNNNGSSNSGQRIHYPNPPEKVNPDTTTLRDQWRFAIRQYSKWYSHAWGTAIFAGGAFFALGWIIKGGNPLPSKDPHLSKSQVSSSKHDD